MWIMMNDGFLSAVENFNNKEELIVRARQYEHLAAIFTDRVDDIYTDDTADYKFRINVTKEEYANTIANRIKEIDYPNFKNSVRDRRFKSFLTEVWHLGVMYFAW